MILLVYQVREGLIIIPAIKDRQKQVLEHQVRLEVSIERKYKTKLKRIALVQQKSMSKLVSDSLIIMYKLDNVKGASNGKN